MLSMAQGETRGKLNFYHAGERVAVGPFCRADEAVAVLGGGLAVDGDRAAFDGRGAAGWAEGGRSEVRFLLCR